MEKLFIRAEDLIQDSFNLALQVYEDGYRPNYIIGVWRGGAPIGIAVQEFFSVLGVPSDHIAIRTSHYKAINQRDSEVQVYGLNYIIKQVESEDSLLIVDDVHDNRNYDGAFQAYMEFCSEKNIKPEIVGNKCGLIKKE